MKHKKEIGSFRDSADIQGVPTGADVDRALNSECQMALAKLVKALPEDAPSLAWRSELNEALLKLQARRQAQLRLRWTFGTLGSLAAASAFLGLFLTRPEFVAPVAVSSVEARLLDAHRDSLFFRTVAGRGMVSSESRPTDAGWQGISWKESDLEAL